MVSGPFVSQLPRGRGFAAVATVALAVALLLATPHAPPLPPTTPAELPAAPILVWFPLMTAPLLWPHWLRR